MNQNIYTAIDTTGKYFQKNEKRGRKSKALVNCQM